ncbi:WD repeat-containing protein 91 homolog isoform X2 [Asparagus officinalis]|uniref:WD repeat-containing protein 91 homolog isoform X2 n=1 Tax=Asparagus officinalis TaxID=4686 RepID=UPI00098DEB6E|nr:WD repeat-containing protein 91 homolog isoform X2 [Asparagus officinalis]
MENMQYAEELLREFLVFRGFTNTLQSFEMELTTDIGKNFQVDKILDLIFKVYIPRYQADKLVGLLNFFKQCFSSTADVVLFSTLLKLELSILRYYVIHALQSGKQEKVVEFFEENGNYLLQKREDWMPWFAIPYLKNPNLDPQFRVYFSKDWLDALLLSFRNFLSEIFHGSRIPALLKISIEKNTVKRLKGDIKQLNHKLSQLQALLEAKESEISQLRSRVVSSLESSIQEKESMNDIPTETFPKENGRNFPVADVQQTGAGSSSLQEGSLSIESGGDASDSAGVPKELTSLKLEPVSSSYSKLSIRSDESEEALQTFQAGNIGEILGEEDFPEVKVDFQETFLGHTSPISRCRFSASGMNIASASVDGTVRIWTHDSSTPTSRNATIFCGAEVMSLDWECRSDRLLLIGTTDGGIKAWNVDAKRVVCDLSTTKEFPSVVDLKCSPVDPIFVSAAASKRQGSSKIDKLGLASLTVWNMKTWKAMSVLPLGKDPPAITSLSFNHNGKILAASATDGMIHMFDMSAGLQITGWPAHDSAVSSVLFGPDETSIFSLGSDGKILEWSLQNQGQVLWSRDCSRFCYPESEKVCRHEISLDSNGRRLLVTSGSVRSPIYQVQGHMRGLKTLPHSAAITSVDWHPTLPIFITGSADHSVRVTSII